MKIKPKYSGKDSKAFWEKINKIKNTQKHSEAYSLAVVLQNTEETILHILNNL